MCNLPRGSKDHTRYKWSLDKVARLSSTSQEGTTQRDGGGNQRAPLGTSGIKVEIVMQSIQR